MKARVWWRIEVEAVVKRRLGYRIARQDRQEECRTGSTGLLWCLTPLAKYGRGSKLREDEDL